MCVVRNTQELFFRFNHMRKFTNHCNCSVRRKVITLTVVVMIIFFIHLYLLVQDITEYCKLSMLFIYLYNYNYKQLICYLCTLNKHYFVRRYLYNKPSSLLAKIWFSVKFPCIIKNYVCTVDLKNVSNNHKHLSRLVFC